MKVTYHKRIVSKAFGDRKLCNMGQYNHYLAKIQWKYVTCKNCWRIKNANY